MFEEDFSWDGTEEDSPTVILSVVFKHVDLTNTKNLVKNISFLLGYDKIYINKFKILIYIDEDSTEKQVLMQLYRGYDYINMFSLPKGQDAVGEEAESQVIVVKDNIDALKDFINLTKGE